MIDQGHDRAGGFAQGGEALREMTAELAATARERLAEGSDRVKDFVAADPVRALGLAFGVGVFLGWLIKRR